ncbi:hypothetical protein B0G57_103121 [Trinickia symbiotica]|uniref:UDP-glucose 4-epimerase n=1 Tax=Trinickia symbiotica TaxID=863227 RepID=A0A2N7X5C7_9BURK|nr:UDP-glucose 4-epimerase [Trinickia symbiotica]PMS36665.1 UDP-glucose 4-epimerase [Trinickia symbiotica]PPK46097.1 hypothetical protein B0G57_103121 [Trinickia symbiotica]
MTMSGKVSDSDWAVSARVDPVPGGFTCAIEVEHSDETRKFAHQFKHHRVFETEREAVLDGLHEGLVWIERKMAHSILCSGEG